MKLKLETREREREQQKIKRYSGVYKKKFPAL